MAAHEDAGRKAAAHELAGARAEQAGDQTTAAEQWQQAQDDRFGNGGE